jgi:hypothetical protein
MIANYIQNFLDGNVPGDILPVYRPSWEKYGYDPQYAARALTWYREQYPQSKAWQPKRIDRVLRDAVRAEL